MAIFEDDVSRKTYLAQQLSDLTRNIQLFYGASFAEELLVRLRDTVSEFDAEVKELMLNLKHLGSKREQLLGTVPSQSAGVQSPSPSVETTDAQDAPAQMSDWEKRLEAMSSGVR